MSKHGSGFQKLGRLPGRMLIVGFGSIGSALLPLLLRHVDIPASGVTILSPHGTHAAIAKEYGVRLLKQGLTEENYREVLDKLVGKDDFLVNLSVNVSSEALVRYCWEHEVLYLDTSIEPWRGGSVDPDASLSRRTNYALREAVMAFRLDKRNGATAVMTQGANPGLISALLKQALVNLAADNELSYARPTSFEDWAALARRLDIKVIHVAERDTQRGSTRKRPNEFVNTWSVDGFIEEGIQPAELGWGTHERHWPDDAQRHGFGSDAAVYLTRPGLATRVRSWTPLGGPYHGFLVTHGESISIADHLTLRESGAVIYRPTVHYAYHPCDDTMLSIDELAGRGWRTQDGKRIMRDDITEGIDELGVLLMGNERGVYWYGSRLSTAQARALVPHNTATSLQVVAGILGGIVWALENPRAGVVEPDDLDHETVLRVARPYLGELVGVYGDWTPLAQHSELFPEPADEDPWQFLNLRVA